MEYLFGYVAVGLVIAFFSFLLKRPSWSGMALTVLVAGLFWLPLVLIVLFFSLVFSDLTLVDNEIKTKNGEGQS